MIYTFNTLQQIQQANKALITKKLIVSQWCYIILIKYSRHQCPVNLSNFPHCADHHAVITIHGKFVHSLIKAYAYSRPKHNYERKQKLRIKHSYNTGKCPQTIKSTCSASEMNQINEIIIKLNCNF